MKKRSTNRKQKGSQPQNHQSEPVPTDEERYRLVVEAVAEGIYEWSVADRNQRLELSPKLLEMFGFAPDELTSASWLERVHPEDRAHYRDVTIAYFKGTTAHFSCEYRILNKADEWRWVSDRGSGIRDQNGRVARLIGAISDITDAKNREILLKESLQQQSTTAEVLKAISRSDFDLQNVLDTLVESATRLCEADHAWLFQRHGDHFRWVASFGHAKEIHDRIGEFFARHEVRPGRGSVTGRAALEGRVVHIVDVLADPEYTYGAAQQIGGYRAALGIPLLRGGTVVGVIFVAKVLPERFTQKQIDLVSIFATQAVIAIENTRLLSELRESLQQQTATADVLKVISRSTFDLQTVLDTLIESATRLCAVDQGVIFLRDGNVLRLRASFGFTPEAVEWARAHPMLPNRGSATGRVALEGKPVHIPDVLADPEYSISDYQKTFRYRTVLSVPMLRDGETIGVFAMTRDVVNPFTEKQIELIATFADQAVIAIENVRLFDEVQKRTDDLTEALEQQTATSQVLQVINSSPGVLQPVFEAMLEKAMELCEAAFGGLWTFEGDRYIAVALSNIPQPYASFLATETRIPGPGTAPYRLLHGEQLVHNIDLASEEPYRAGDPGRRALVDLGGARTALQVPLRKEDSLLGVITIYRKEVRPFTDKQIELVQNFAAQAVIAIENTRLLNELRESLQQQTATADVLKVISRSTFELQPVFDSMAASAVKLCEAERAYIFRFDGEMLRAVASFNAGPENQDWVYRNPIPLGRHSVSARAGLERRTVQVVDVQADPEYSYVARDVDPIRTTLAVPMLKGEELIGTITIYRLEVKPFTEGQVALMETFADQAVIAIENVRLFEEVKKRTEDLSEALEQQTATSEVLKVISSSPGDLKPVFETMLENAVRICGAKFGTLFRFDGEKFHTSAFVGAPQDYVDYQTKRGPFVPPPTAPLAQLLRTNDVVRTLDMSAQTTPVVEFVQLAGTRSHIAVPMLREDELVGAIVIYNQEVQPFTDKQVELVQNFAAQAVIAIENTRLLSELRESLQQQTATADVLKVISRSTFDLQAVLDTLTESATRLCRAERSAIRLLKDGLYYNFASYGFAPEHKARMEREPTSPGQHSIAGRVALERKTIQLIDAQADPDPDVARRSKSGNVRTMIGVPLLREGLPIGVLLLQRGVVQPFSSQEIALAETFADQAVIAIENVRLFDEVQTRTRELSQSLEHQTATSEVLNVISRSPTNAQPVFEAIAGSAARLCEAVFTVVWLYDGDLLHYVSSHNFTAEVLDQIKKTFPKPPDRSLAAGRAILDGKIAHVPDMLADPAYAHELAMAGNWRASIAVPMLRDGKSVGAISVGKAEPGPFTERQMQLLTTFADQAVIAIENVRLFEEVQKRTEDLTEALEQQTATSEVLKVISSSPGELQPVFQATLENATRVCEASFGMLFRLEGDVVVPVASRGVPQAFLEFIQRGSHRASPTAPITRVAHTKHVVHIADFSKEQAYLERNPMAVAGVELAGVRTLLVVPMLKENELIGVFAIFRQEVRRFSDKQIELVQNFAAQAVIAIENTRLLNELRQSLQQQTATADVLKTISQSTFDLQTVLNTLTESAVRLCAAERANIWRPEGDVFKVAATFALAPEHEEMLRLQSIRPGRDTITGRTILEGKTVHIPDVMADADYKSPILKFGVNRTVLGVPLVREGVAIGVLVVTRSIVKPFTTSEIALIETFANQASIAIENVRLFESVEARTHELARSLEELQNAQDRLVQTQKLASLGQLTAGIAHEIKNPLNFVNNFSSLSTELLDELQESLERVQSDEKTRADINELTDTLRANLNKIEQHGKRADSIVKNMLLHSREGSGEHRPIDINAVVEESLNLAYHGARAEKQDFNITLERSFDPAAGEVDVFPQEITRVLLNLIANGFYAATKRKALAGSDPYEPALTASTRSLGDKVEIRIRDNGTGIPPEVKEKMFNPFFTTKPPGEGTGLGLSLSHDIIVKQHAGSIEIDTKPGTFTEFKIILPRAAATIAKAGGRA